MILPAVAERALVPIQGERIQRSTPVGVSFLEVCFRAMLTMMPILTFRSASLVVRLVALWWSGDQRPLAEWSS